MQRARTKTAATTAKTADKHVLYQLSVQAPDVDVPFFARYFKRLTGRPLRVFREDFCGTALLCCEFAKHHRDNLAIGVDIHGPTLSWAKRHNVSTLEPNAQARVQLIQDDVRAVTEPAADLTAGLNFSYSIFKTRPELLDYMRAARRALKDDGVFMIDAWGGSDSLAEMEDVRRIRANGQRFTYIWDQAKFDPISHNSVCKIHFAFEDGTALRNAFTYDWRLWTLPELRELMTEAGFADVHVLWEGTDRDTNEGNGIYRRVKRGDADPAWIAYVVGRPS
ncbi:MAG: class I SAM-dependent methyltransferase [Planctomycetota bacterium]